MASYFIYQKQGRLQVTLDTGVSIGSAFKAEIEYITPETETEVVVTATVVETTKVRATITPLPDEYGIFKFQSRITFLEGEEPVLGRPYAVRVLEKWTMPSPPYI